MITAEETDDVLFGAQGAAAVLPPGTPVIVCPTISPGDAERIAAKLAERGLLPVDAPMSGGPARARDGTMSLMAACGREAWSASETLLRTLSDKVFRVGTRCGDGAKTKLVNNLLAGINLAGAAEAMAMAQRLGLDLPTTLGVIEQSSGQSWIGSDRLRRAIAGDYEPRAHVTLLQNDTRLAVEAVRAAGSKARSAGRARRVRTRRGPRLGHFDKGRGQPLRSANETTSWRQGQKEPKNPRCD